MVHRSNLKCQNYKSSRITFKGLYLGIWEDKYFLDNTKCTNHKRNKNELQT